MSVPVFVREGLMYVRTRASWRALTLGASLQASFCPRFLLWQLAEQVSPSKSTKRHRFNRFVPQLSQNPFNCAFVIHFFLASEK